MAMIKKPTYQELEILREAIKNSIHEVHIFNTDNFKFTFVNDVTIKNLGYSFEELKEMTPIDLTPEFNHEQALKKLAPLRSGKIERLSFETYRQRKDKSLYPVEINVSKFKIENKFHFLAFVIDIAERKISEKKLKESEFLLKEAQEIAKLGHWELDLINNKLTWSDEVFRIFNFKPQEFKPTYANFLESIHPKDRDLVNEAYLDSLKNKTSYSVTHRLLLNNNKIKFVLEKGNTDFNKEGKPIRTIGTILDITERKNVEKSLLKIQKKLQNQNLQIKEKNKNLALSEKRFKNLFNNSPVSLWEEDISEVIKLLNKKILEVDNLKLYLDENPEFVLECASKIKVLNVNNSTLNLLGVESKEELIANLSKNFNSKSFETFKEELLVLTTKEKVFKRETEFFKIDGTTIFINLELVLVENDKVIVSMSDVTELKESKDKAEESDRLKTEFINNMSHEIRTPMNGILGFTELLVNPDLNEDKRKYFVKIIKNSGYQLLQIIDDILEISRLGTKQVKVYEEQINLNDLLLELFSIFDQKAKENNTPLYLQNQLKNKQSIILTDKTKLNKILSNLLDNALKFTNVGTIEFGYNLIENNKLKQLEIYVKDTGKGIKKEDQELIFERFSQAEKDISKNIKGLGLGLSIAKENTELLGGKISLESKKGEGTTFYVTIPYKPVFEDKETHTEKIEEKQTILIVEDEEINYLYLSTLIQDVLKFNCTILHAKNGIEAIKIYKDNPTIVIILMDLKMPVMNGYDATTEIKKINTNITIIAQTAYSTKNEIKKALAYGCDDFISKPISKESLFNIITKFVPNL